MVDRALTIDGVVFGSNGKSIVVAGHVDTGCRRQQGDIRFIGPVKPDLGRYVTESVVCRDPEDTVIGIIIKSHGSADR